MIIILFLLSSCVNRIDRDRLIGKYVWNDGRIDTLEVRADGTYEYWTFVPGRKMAHSGTWKFDSTVNKVEFESENFPFLTSHAPDGSWFSRARIINSEVQLMYTLDGHMFLKQIKTLTE
jgi:hypothetical protein